MFASDVRNLLVYFHCPMGCLPFLKVSEVYSKKSRKFFGKFDFFMSYVNFNLSVIFGNLNFELSGILLGNRNLHIVFSLLLIVNNVINSTVIYVKTPSIIFNGSEYSEIAQCICHKNVLLDWLRVKPHIGT